MSKGKLKIKKMYVKVVVMGLDEKTLWGVGGVVSNRQPSKSKMTHKRPTLCVEPYGIYNYTWPSMFSFEFF